MLAVSGRPPQERGRWAFEMKWDGIRAIARCGDGDCRLYSRNNRDLSGSFPELTAVLADLGEGGELLLDGEIVAPDPVTGAPSFGRLQRRMHVISPGAELLRGFPAQYLAFDLLALDGSFLMNLPYTERRERLAELALDRPLARTPPYYPDIDPTTLMDVAREHGLEGIIAKRLDSAYYPGRRSPLWIKTPLRRTTEVVVAGWLPGTGRFSTTFGSLALGAYDDHDQLVHIGNVGTGWTMHARRSLQTRLNELARPDTPFDIAPPRALAATAHWVEPVLVADIEYREVTPEGLRHPSWRGLRPDRSPREAKVPPSQ
ncbi:non-homologous end-joining DNA ligase [Streptomyces gardneri]|uniref:non-homologous end-joining DNA ligase n=1 Tax=Nocardia sputi TaxID=2943705 RepID=UPI001895A3C0|nr:non-homologous end-joining DNA ligase [Nocardia sputi]MBF6166339.1 non-homologous end-joining DNA ligase [Streptomyces gardneri]MBF6205123.1 non-homologous end-joining DNA ligase [Streptomyces gardneri]